MDKKLFSKEAYDWLGCSPGYDLQYNIWDGKYRFDNEDLSHWFQRVSGGNMKIADLIQQRKFIFGGRTLANRGIPNSGSFSNCYSIGYVGDTLPEILKANTDIALTFCAHGGQGLSLSKIRPAGSLIKGKYTTDGIVPFMRMFNTTTETISQGGSRKGALMMSLSVWHPEIETFISIKSDKNEINKANLSVEIDDEFMECVKAGVTEKRCEFYYNDTVYEYTINPVAIFEKICQNARDHAEPGILFTNRLRNYNLMEKVEGYQIETTNPCVTGDTQILTIKGYKPIEDLVDDKVTIWNGYQWSEVTPKVTGQNQDVYQVNFSDGSSVKCTNYHKWVMKDQTRKETKDLQKGDKLTKCTYPIIESQAAPGYDETFMYTLGFFAGDGSFTSNGSPVLYLYGSKRDLLPYFVNGVVRIDKTNDERTVLTIQDWKSMFNKDFVPSVRNLIRDRIIWLAGLIDADGSLNSSDGCITITSVNQFFLQQVKYMLNTLGCNATISLMKHGGKRMLPNHKGGLSEYNCQDCYRLVINASNVYKLMNLGLKTNRVVLQANPNRDASRFIQVVSVEYIGKVDKVYCLTEPHNHTFIANGVITGNCGEQPLPKHGACNLCSINLSEYVLNPFTSEACIDFDNLSEDIGHIVTSMDDIVSENMMRHALPEQRMMAEKYRNIGIGIMGLADMFVKLGVTYGDDKSLRWTELVMSFITREAILSSAALANSRGTFPGYDPLMLESEFAKTVLTEGDRHYIRNCGLRNSTFISVAPTGSVGTMFNIGTGVEPFFRLEYVRTTKSLGGKEQEHRERPRIIQEYLNHIGKEDIDIKDLPEYFVSSDMIDYRQRIKLQAILQKYTDTGISSTINLPKGTSVETIYELYMLAWKEGLKGVTVYVDGSRDGILTENGNTPKGKRTKVHAKPRPKSLEAEYYPVRVKGENFGVIVGYMDDEPYEIFAIRPDKVYPQHFGTVTKVKKRVYKFESDKMVVDNMLDFAVVSDSEGNISLLVSAMLRHEMPVEFIADVVRKTSDSIVSYSSSLAKILDKHAKPRVLKDKCPDCGGDLIREGGCTHCSMCEYAKCGD